MISKLSIFAINLVICFQTFGQICGTSVNNGVLSPTMSWQTVTGFSGNSYYWSFSGESGKAYGFSLCESISEDTEIRIYNASFSQIDRVDDSGPYCSGSNASIKWVCQNSATYYVQIINYGCDPLQSDYTLKYSQQLAQTPTVTGLNPTTTRPYNYISILGSNFGDVTRVYYKTSFGTDYTSGSSYTNFYSFYTDSDIISGNLTLTGGFGSVVTPLLTIAYEKPTVTGLNPTSTRPNSTISILGSNFGDVSAVYYKTSSGTYSRSTDNFTNYLVFTPYSDIISGNLTLLEVLVL